MGVQFQHLAVLAGGLHHRLQVDLVGLPLQQHPARGMGDRRDVRIFQGSITRRVICSRDCCWP